MAKLFSYLKDSYINTSHCDLKFKLEGQNVGSYLVNVKLSKGLSLDKILSESVQNHLRQYGYFTGGYRIYSDDGLTEVSPEYIPRKSQTFRLKRIYKN